MTTFFKDAVQFLKEAYFELKKVSWLSKKEVIASTIVIIILVFLISLFVGFTDFIISKFMGILI